jgi:hypothetical protein
MGNDPPKKHQDKYINQIKYKDLELNSERFQFLLFYAAIFEINKEITSTSHNIHNNLVLMHDEQNKHIEIAKQIQKDITASHNILCLNMSTLNNKQDNIEQTIKQMKQDMHEIKDAVSRLDILITFFCNSKKEA